MTLRVDQRCENCWCFEPVSRESVEDGECRRHAPWPRQGDDGPHYAYWPYVNVDLWCAEWAPKDREE